MYVQYTFIVLGAAQWFDISKSVNGKYPLFLLTRGGRLIVFASMILEAWKLESDPIENQLEFDTPDLWLMFERPDVTERPDSELIEDKARKTGKKDIVVIFWQQYSHSVEI